MARISHGSMGQEIPVWPQWQPQWHSRQLYSDISRLRELLGVRSQWHSLMKINCFFTDTLGAQLKNSRWSWGATDPLNHRVYLRVWRNDIQETASGERIRIARDKSSRLSNGFAERHRHVDLIRDGTPIKDTQADHAEAGHPQSKIGSGTPTISPTRLAVKRVGSR
jgi:hypothetical protein